MQRRMGTVDGAGWDRTASGRIGNHQRRRGLERRRLGAALSTVALTAAGLGSVGVGTSPASATIGPAGIAPGINISVFHNIDFVATFGWPVGQSVTVDVLRNGVLIGSATGPTVDAGADGGALEVNHGPAAAPQPGDCWEGHTPDVRPGDLVRVTGGGTVSEVIVDNISLNGPATLNGATQDVEVRGVALTAAGAPIPLAALNSGEFRDVLPNGQFRATPDAVVADPGVSGGFVMQYHSPYNGFRQPDDSTLEQRRDSLLTADGHAAGFGHVAPLPDEAMLVEGFGDSPGPALGCEGSPSASHAIGSVSPQVINRANSASDLTVSGSTANSTAVQVNLTDGTASAGPFPATVSGAGTSQTWTVTVPAAQLSALNGSITVTAAHTPDLGAAQANTRTVLRDVVAPGAPVVSPNGGAISGPRSVSISGAAGDRLFYTVGNGSQPAPAVAPGGTVSGTAYAAPFTVTAGQVVKALAVDAAANASAVTTSAFTQAATPAPPAPAPGSAVLPLAPRIGAATAGARGGALTAVARWSAPPANGAVVRGYEVRALKIRPGRAAKIRPAVAVGASTRRVRLTLPAGSYRFQVRAVGAAGASPWSAPSAKVTAR